MQSIPKRKRTLLKAVLYYDNRRISIYGIVKDMSESGARIEVPEKTLLPDTIEIGIPQRDLILPAIIKRRSGNEIGVQFLDQRSGKDRRKEIAKKDC